jgi:hypothetical protein
MPRNFLIHIFAYLRDGHIFRLLHIISIFYLFFIKMYFVMLCYVQHKCNDLQYSQLFKIDVLFYLFPSIRAFATCNTSLLRHKGEGGGTGKCSSLRTDIFTRNFTELSHSSGRNSFLCTPLRYRFYTAPFVSIIITIRYGTEWRIVSEE